MPDMFDNLSVESAPRQTTRPALEVPPSITKIIDEAWDTQQSDPKQDGHIVPLTSKADVEVFHKYARAACGNRTPALKYRRLIKVGPRREENEAYFGLRLESEEDGKAAAPAENTSGNGRSVSAQVSEANFSDQAKKANTKPVEAVPGPRSSVKSRK